jgi:hypothetical protein
LSREGLRLLFQWLNDAGVSPRQIGWVFHNALSEDVEDVYKVQEMMDTMASKKGGRWEDALAPHQQEGKHGAWECRNLFWGPGLNDVDDALAKAGFTLETRRAHYLWWMNQGGSDMKAVEKNVHYDMTSAMDVANKTITRQEEMTRLSNVLRDEGAGQSESGKAIENNIKKIRQENEATRNDFIAIGRKHVYKATPKWEQSSVDVDAFRAFLVERNAKAKAGYEMQSGIDGAKHRIEATESQIKAIEAESKSWLKAYETAKDQDTANTILGRAGYYHTRFHLASRYRMRFSTKIKEKYNTEEKRDEAFSEMQSATSAKEARRIAALHGVPFWNTKLFDTHVQNMVKTGGWTEAKGDAAKKEFRAAKTDDDIEAVAKKYSLDQNNYILDVESYM